MTDATKNVSWASFLGWLHPDRVHHRQLNPIALTPGEQMMTTMMLMNNQYLGCCSDDYPCNR